MKSATRDFRKFIIFWALIFYWFWVDFGSILDAFFDDFSMILALLFRDLFLMIFSSFTNRFLNRANHEIIKKPLVFIGFSALGTFRTRSIVRRISIRKSHNFGIICSWISRLFRHRFSHWLFHWFWSPKKRSPGHRVVPGWLKKGWS